MIYSLEHLLERIDSGSRVKYLLFWGHQPGRVGSATSSCLSQWFESPFEVDGITYRTAEHWMMAKKALLFEDEEALKKIFNATTPGEAKSIGRQVLNFNDTVWESSRTDIVIEGNKHKFSQNPELQKFLLDTRERILVEASPIDPIWGIGIPKDHIDAENPHGWKGLNLLGFSLMEVRDQLRKNTVLNT